MVPGKKKVEHEILKLVLTFNKKLQQELHMISNITEPLFSLCVGRAIACVIQLK